MQIHAYIIIMSSLIRSNGLVIVSRIGIAGLFQCGFMAVIVWILDVSWELYCCIIIGLAAGTYFASFVHRICVSLIMMIVCVCHYTCAGLMIGTVSEIFTSSAYPPVLSIAKSSRIGPANVVIAVSCSRSSAFISQQSFPLSIYIHL